MINNTKPTLETHLFAAFADGMSKMLDMMKAKNFELSNETLINLIHKEAKEYVEYVMIMRKDNNEKN